MQGMNLVVVSGGSGGNVLSAALAPHLEDVRSVKHIVTSFDNGSSSGELRRAFGVPAVGDLRNVLGSYFEPDAQNGLEYRASVEMNSEPSGVNHPLGNIVLAHMMAGRSVNLDVYRDRNVSSDVVDTAQELVQLGRAREGYSSARAAREYLSAFGANSKVSATMISDEPGDLVATWRNGVVRGESQIGSLYLADDEEVRLSIVSEQGDQEPAMASCIVDAFKEAHAVIIAPGSSITSIGQALAHLDIAAGVHAARKLIMVGNVVDPLSYKPNHRQSIANVATALGGRRPNIFIANSGVSGDASIDAHLLNGGVEDVDTVLAGDMLALSQPGKDNDQVIGAVHDAQKLGDLIIEALSMHTPQDHRQKISG